MPGAHLLLLLLVPLGVGVFLLLRRRPQTSTQLLLALATAGVTWLIVFAWYTRKPAPAQETEAFQTVEYLVREVPAEWLWRELFLMHGWTLGLVLFGACWLLARRTRRS